MIISADNITLAFLVVSAVTLAVVSVLVWYIYHTKKFKQDIIKLMDEKLEMYLDNLNVPDELPPVEEVSDEKEFAEKDFVEKDLNHLIEDLNHLIEEIKKFPETPQ